MVICLLPINFGLPLGRTRSLKINTPLAKMHVKNIDEFWISHGVSTVEYLLDADKNNTYLF